MMATANMIPDNALDLDRAVDPMTS